jgi:hypothetical protein
MDRCLASHADRKSSIRVVTGDVLVAIEEMIMSKLRERMSNAICQRGLAAQTQESYIGALVDL